MTHAEREKRVSQILRLAATHKALVRVFSRNFTADELGAMFDALPANTGQPMTTLADAIGTAWSDVRDGVERDDAGKPVTS